MSAGANGTLMGGRCATAGRGVRVPVDPLVYVNFPDESAFLLNLSERGMALQCMDVLEPGRPYSFSFPLPEIGAELRGLARIVWSDRSGRAGMEFVRLSEFDRLALTTWISRQTH